VSNAIRVSEPVSVHYRTSLQLPETEIGKCRAQTCAGNSAKDGRESPVLPTGDSTRTVQPAGMSVVLAQPENRVEETAGIG